MNHTRRTITTAAGLTTLFLLAIPTTATAATCVPDAGQPYIAPTLGDPDLLVPAVPSWDELLEHPAVDATYGDRPVIEDAVPAWTQTITHPAVDAVYGDRPLITPAADAWDELIPASGTETIPNPGHVPASTVNHPAVYITVNHAAEYRTEYQWKWWGTVGHGATVWTDGTYPAKSHNGWGGDWRKNGNTRQVLVKAAWSEQVLKTPAWVETIPAQGPETIPNPNYVAEHTITHPATDAVYGEAPLITPAQDAWTETIEHPEIPAVLGDAPVLTPAVPAWTEAITHPAIPAVWDTAPVIDPGQTYVAPNTCDPEGDDTTATVVVNTTPGAVPPAAPKVTAPVELAHTGTDPLVVAAIGAGALTLGGFLVAARRRQTRG